MGKDFTKRNACDGVWRGSREGKESCQTARWEVWSEVKEREGTREGVFLDCHAVEKSFGKAVGESYSWSLIRGVPVSQEQVCLSIPARIGLWSGAVLGRCGLDTSLLLPPPPPGDFRAASGALDQLPSVQPRDGAFSRPP